MPLPVGELLGVWLGVALLLKDTLSEVEAEAPEVREAVGLADTVELPLRVEEGVGCAVPVPVRVALPVAVPLGL